MEESLINKVAESGLISIDLERFLPSNKTAIFDLKEYLYMGMILREKEFREALKKLDWEIYRDKDVAITCSADAIIPMWAYMLIASYLQPVAGMLVVGDEKDLHKTVFLKNISAINLDDFRDQRVVIKGCGDTPIGEFAYMEITRLLRPLVKSIMYGEPCSTVPIFKKAAG